MVVARGGCNLQVATEHLKLNGKVEWSGGGRERSNVHSRERGGEVRGSDMSIER